MPQYDPETGNYYDEWGAITNSRPWVNPPRGEAASAKTAAIRGKWAEAAAREAAAQERRDTTGSMYLLTSMYRVAFAGLCYLAFTHQLSASPKVTLLRYLHWYQTFVSAGRNLCPRGPEHNCSKQAVAAVERLGAARGTIAICRIIAACKRYQRHLLEPGLQTRQDKRVDSRLRLSTLIV